MSLSFITSAEPFVVPFTQTEINVNGVIREHEYKYAATFAGAANYRAAIISGTPAVVDSRETECAVTWDEDYLYIATRSATLDGGQLPKGGPKSSAFSSESIELWFDPPAEMRQAEFARFGQFQITVAWTGRFDMLHHNPGYGYPTGEWKSDGVKVQNSIVGNIWDCEVAIPASAFGAEKFTEGEWGILLGRNFKTHPEVQCTYSPFNSRGGYTDPTAYSRMVLKRNVSPSHFNGQPKMIHSSIPVVVPCNITARVKTTGVTPPKEYRRFFASQDLDGNGYFGLQEVADPDGTPHMTMFFHARARNQFLNFIHKQVPVPGDETVLSLNVFEDKIVYYYDGAWVGEIATDVPIKTGDFGDCFPGDGAPGIEILEFRISDHAFSLDELKRSAQGEQGVAGDVKWYPSLGMMACALSLPEPADDSELPTMSIYDENGLEVRSFRLPVHSDSAIVTKNKFPMMVIHDKVSLADENGQGLPEGQYSVVLYSGKTQEAVIKKNFLVKEYEWFNTTVGTQDIVLPGFTPVETYEDSIATVGRNYIFGTDGLPKEIWSLNEQILAGPVTISGIPEIQDGSLEIVRKSDTCAEFTGGLASGRVEQDGLIVLNLHLPETQGDVALKVPLKPEFAFLFHPTGAGIRINPAGFLPEGKGRLFHSRAIPQINNGNFIPYCWIGSDDRGICYTADSDQGWIHSKEKDAVEIYRQEDDTIVLSLNLLNGEEIHDARDITVTLMASPVKPMPKGWRGWVDAYDVPAERNTVNNCSNPTWGCYIVGMARYPTFMDWEFVRKMCEPIQTGKVDDEYVENWIARCMKAREEQPELVPWLAKMPKDEAAKTLRAHAFAAFRRTLVLHGKKKTVFYYYTCDADPCTGLYELPVMADEWGNATAVYGSHTDYAIYYLKKMCENGMTGVYDDNAFFRCNYDWVTGNAWIDEAGEVHPSYSFWALREFCRRQIVAMLEAGIQEPWLTIHHTNANILSTMSYATNTMGMEWKYGNSEYQDRYTRDYIRTVNQGYQGGFFATSLEGIFETQSPEQSTFVTRTMLAALLPHEVQPTLSQTGDHQLVLKALRIKQEFGVGKDDCEYHAYYDANNPVIQPNDDIMISVYRRGDAMLLVIGSYAEEDVELELRLKEGTVISAVNAENGAPLAIEDGATGILLKRRDFAMIELKVSDF